MQVICSERQFFGQIRQLEGIDPNVTNDELSVRSLFYARKLFDYVKGFGVDLIAGPQIHGTLATFSMSLKPAWDEESVAKRLEGLSMLAPVAVSLELPDLGAFVTEPIMRAALQDQFGAFSPQLQRLTVGEIRPALENCARQLLAAPVNAPTNDFEAEMQDMELQALLINAGKTDLLRKEQKRREVEEFRRKEEEAYAAQQQAAYDAQWNRED